MSGMRAEDALQLAKIYVKKTLQGMGALKGKNATIQSITQVAGGNNVVFSWTLDDGTVKTQTMFVKDGADGTDGISPAATIQRNTANDGVIISITDKDGITEAELKDGQQGVDGSDGQGVPAGGTTGQVLVKKSETDFDTEWRTPQAGTGGSITTDAVPTQGSTNPVQSGGVFTALEGKQNKITGTEDQYVSFNENGEAVAKTVEYKKHIVVAVAGQSNAVGYDESRVDEAFLSKNKDPLRIKQLGYKNTNNLQLIPLTYCAENVQDMYTITNAGGTTGTKGIHLPLANLMLDYIPDDYGIIIVPVAHGSTGFTNGNANIAYNSGTMKPNTLNANLKWGTDTALYQTLRDRIKHALNLNPENLFAGIVWIQGEDDATQPDAHKTAFEAMTEYLFNELNNEGYGSRTPSGTFNRDIWYNVETVAYWYTQGQCQRIWDNYKAWNPNTYVEIPRTVDSNDVGGNGNTSSTKPSHYGNNAFSTDIAPRVLAKMAQVGAFGSKCGTPEAIGSTYFPGVPVVTDVDRMLTQADLKTSRTTNTITIDGDGNCTLDANISSSMFNTSQSQVIFGDVSKIDFEVKRSLYWLVLERDYDANKFVIVGVGKNLTGRVVDLTVGGNPAIKEIIPTTNNNKDFAVGDRLRIYRNTDGSVTVYHKAFDSNLYEKWLSIPAVNTLKERTLGFVCGLSVDEYRSPFDGDLNVLFNSMKIQTNTPYPNYQVYDMKLLELEASISGVNGGTDNDSGNTIFPDYNVVTDGERVLEQSDLLVDTPVTGVNFTITDGSCTLDQNISASLFTDTKAQIIFGNVSMIDFEVKRSTYWLVLERDVASESLLVLGFGGAYTGQVSKLVGNRHTENVQTDTGSLNKTFGYGDRVRVYRNVDGSVTVYHKLSSSNTFVKWFDKEAFDIYPDKVFGFACGVAQSETAGFFYSNLNALFDTMKIQESTPYPNYQVSDIRIASLETLLAQLSSKVSSLETSLAELSSKVAALEQAQSQTP